MVTVVNGDYGYGDYDYGGWLSITEPYPYPPDHLKQKLKLTVKFFKEIKINKNNNIN